MASRTAGTAAVSTGHLPPRDHVRQLVNQAYTQYRANVEGATSNTYPALAQMPGDLFGICIASVAGELYWVGDSEHAFTIMSVAKPFVFALVCQALGAEQLRKKVGVNATGMRFNSVVAFELRPDRLTNPMVNAGALATTSLAPGETAAQKWRFIIDGLSRFAGREVRLNSEVYASASATNLRNHGIARLLESEGRLYFDAAATTDLYTMQSCVSVTAKDLAVMGSTLANGGVNPLTKETVVEAEICRRVLAVMATAGLYETSGDWLYAIGLPGKSGISGGIVTVAPGKGGMGTFAPLLDGSGNSIKGRLTANFLSERLGLNLFTSASSRG